MRIQFQGRYAAPPRQLMRRCGYGERTDPRTGQVSYARSLSRGLYPRFHAYVEGTVDGFNVNLHLDQKQPSYGRYTKHSGEYEGEVVEREGERVRQMIQSQAVKLGRGTTSNQN